MAGAGFEPCMTAHSLRSLSGRRFFTSSLQKKRRAYLSLRLALVAGAGFEPATFGL